MKKALFGLLLLVAAGCSNMGPVVYTIPAPAPTPQYVAPIVASSQDVVQLRTEVALDENRLQVGYGSAFAVSPKVLLTALHCVDEFSTLKINGYTLDVVKVVPFGNDGAAIIVSNMPKWVKIYDISDTSVRGTSVICYGYNPETGQPMSATGIITAPGVSTSPIRVGNSGGPVVCDGKVIGINSTILPQLGVMTYQIIPIDIVRSLERME